MFTGVKNARKDEADAALSLRVFLFGPQGRFGQFPSTHAHGT